MISTESRESFSVKMDKLMEVLLKMSPHFFEEYWSLLAIGKRLEEELEEPELIKEEDNLSFGYTVTEERVVLINKVVALITQTNDVLLRDTTAITTVKEVWEEVGGYLEKAAELREFIADREEDEGDDWDDDDETITLDLFNPDWIFLWLEILRAVESDESRPEIELLQSDEDVSDILEVLSLDLADSKIPVHKKAELLMHIRLELNRIIEVFVTIPYAHYNVSERIIIPGALKTERKWLVDYSAQLISLLPSPVENTEVHLQARAWGEVMSLQVAQLPLEDQQVFFLLVNQLRDEIIPQYVNDGKITQEDSRVLLKRFWDFLTTVFGDQMEAISRNLSENDAQLIASAETVRGLSLPDDPQNFIKIFEITLLQELSRFLSLQESGSLNQAVSELVSQLNEEISKWENVGFRRKTKNQLEISQGIIDSVEDFWRQVEEITLSFREARLNDVNFDQQFQSLLIKSKAILGPTKYAEIARVTPSNLSFSKHLALVVLYDRAIASEMTADIFYSSVMEIVS